jgi:hypothetical protein
MKIFSVQLDFYQKKLWWYLLYRCRLETMYNTTCMNHTMEALAPAKPTRGDMASCVISRYKITFYIYARIPCLTFSPVFKLYLREISVSVSISKKDQFKNKCYLLCYFVSYSDSSLGYCLYFFYIEKLMLTI